VLCRDDLFDVAHKGWKKSAVVEPWVGMAISDDSSRYRTQTGVVEVTDADEKDGRAKPVAMLDETR
jgi:hypothetical protein